MKSELETEREKNLKMLEAMRKLERMVEELEVLKGDAEKSELEELRTEVRNCLNSPFSQITFYFSCRESRFQSAFQRWRLRFLKRQQR